MENDAPAQKEQNKRRPNAHRVPAAANASPFRHHAFAAATRSALRTTAFLTAAGRFSMSRIFLGPIAFASTASTPKAIKRFF